MAVSCSETQRLVLANSLLPPLTCPRCLQAVAGQAPELAQWRPIAALLMGSRARHERLLRARDAAKKTTHFGGEPPLPTATGSIVQQ